MHMGKNTHSGYNPKKKPTLMRSSSMHSTTPKFLLLSNKQWMNIEKYFAHPFKTVNYHRAQNGLNTTKTPNPSTPTTNTSPSSTKIMKSIRKSSHLPTKNKTTQPFASPIKHKDNKNQSRTQMRRRLTTA